MRNPLKALAVLALIPLAACATDFRPTVVSASDANVTYRIAPDRLAETKKAAEDYCAARGRTARLDRVTPTGEGNSVAAFSCY